MSRSLFAAILASSLLALALPSFCYGDLEAILLMPTGAVTLDGLILTRAPDSGRYEDDEGLSFDVERLTLNAVRVDVPEACGEQAVEATLSTIDPFDADGGAVTVRLTREGAP